MMRAELAMLKGIQDPSMQVNSEQASVAFLLPGGGTVLSDRRQEMTSLQMSTWKRRHVSVVL